MRDIEHQIHTDVLVIGSGGAGARAALAAKEAGAEVLLVSKGRMVHSGATLCAPGDYAINSRAARQLGLDGDEDDSPEAHAQDTFLEGKQVNDWRLVQLLAEQAPHRILELRDMGVPWTKLGHYIGHRYPRSAMVGTAGKTGVAMVRALKRALSEHNVHLWEDAFVSDLIASGDGVRGALAIDMATGTPVLVHCKALVLACGGGSRCYELTTGPEELTGDGTAMAYRVGAELIDMEFVQFSPYGMAWPSALRGHTGFIYEYMSLLDARLLNSSGERFMARWDPERMEKSTRDMLSIGMTSEILGGRGSPHGGVYLSFEHLPRADLEHLAETYFPGYRIGKFCLTDFLPDPYGQPFEVAPAAHHFMGGVRIDEHCATNVPGLFAAGEVEGAVHGANRISGNALAETQVFGAIAGQSAAAHAMRVRKPRPADGAVVAECLQAALAPCGRATGESAAALRRHVQSLAWQKLGVIRGGDGLQSALAELTRLRTDAVTRLAVCTTNRCYNQEWFRALEVRNMVDTLLTVAVSALHRCESRGAHYRTDYPEQSNDSQNTVLCLGHGEPQITSVSVRQDSKPARGKG